MLQMKNIPVEERPREKGIRYGVESLSDRELLALFIRSGTKEKSALEIADEVLIYCGGIQGLETVSIQELSTIHGISATKALELKAALELKNRSIRETTLQRNVVHTPEEIATWLRYTIGPKAQEEFIAVYLNGKGEIVYHETVFKGSFRQSLVSPYEIFKSALRQNATGILVAHNHPSGSLNPSKEDLLVTRRLLECAKMMQVELLDHLIITRNGYTSIRSIQMWPPVQG